MRIINETEIQKIEAFLEKKDIIYHDLKMELIDHMSTSIEGQWEENPDLSFEEAFDIEYKNFGIFGFSDILEKRQVSLNRYYWKSIGKHMLNWLKIPQIFFTILVGYSIFQILQSDYNVYFRNIVIHTGIAVSIISSSYLVWKIRQKKKNKEPVLLMDQTIAQSSGLLYFSGFFGHSNLFNFETKVFTDVQLFVWTALLLIFSFLIYHLVYDFPKNKRKYFKSNFRVAQ